MGSWPFYDLDIDESTDRVDDVADYVSTFGIDELAEKPFVNIGAGDWQHPLWSNLDFVQPPYDKYIPPRYNIDLGVLERLPINDSSVYLAFTSHTVEHLTSEQLRFWFGEVHRILKPGGVFRIVTPEIDTAFWAYMLGDMRYYDHRYNARKKSDTLIMPCSKGFGRKYGSIAKAFLARFASCLGNPPTLLAPNGTILPTDEAMSAWFNTMPSAEAYDRILALSDYARKAPNQHINWFTGEKLDAMLRAAGFRYTIRTSYGQSICPLMRNKVYFDKTRPNESIYYDAVKDSPSFGFKEFM